MTTSAHQKDHSVAADRPQPPENHFKLIARLSGVLYLVIITCGVGGQALVRDPLLAADPTETLANLVSAQQAFRASILADVLMALCDVALAVLLFRLLRPVDALLSRLAMTFRTVQASILGLNLVFLYAAAAALPTNGAIADASTSQHPALALLEAHAAGYDLALFFFAINCGLTGALLLRLKGAPRWLGWTLGASGLVYLAGSTLRILSPAAAAAFAPAYGVPLLAELSLAVWLLTAPRALLRLAEPLARPVGDTSSFGPPSLTLASRSLDANSH